MAEKWLVHIFVESDVIECSSEEDADDEAERQNRISNAFTRIERIEDQGDDDDENELESGENKN